MEILRKLKLQPLELEVACDMAGTKVRGAWQGLDPLTGWWGQAGRCEAEHEEGGVNG